MYTDYRPTPLQHYIFPSGGDGIHLVVDENVRLMFDSSFAETVIYRNVNDFPGFSEGIYFNSPNIKKNKITSIANYRTFVSNSQLHHMH